MLSITFNPDRPREKGQYYVELIDINIDDPAYSHRFGYWCDLGHLFIAIGVPVLSELGKIFDDHTILEWIHKGRKT